MKDLVINAVTVFMGFFAIMNPLANAPVFLGLTADDDPATRRAIASKAILLAFAIVAAFSVLGKLIFHLFGLTMPALQIAGGILVFKIGFDMLHGEASKTHSVSDARSRTPTAGDTSVAISPLAVPILAGPGTIATAMNFSAAQSNAPILITVASFAVLCVLTYAVFLGGERLVRFVGPSGLTIVSRLMGLILAVIGVQMTIVGVKGAAHLAG